MGIHFLLALSVFPAGLVVCFHEISLNGQWTVQSSDQAISIDGTVPGSMYTALLQQGLIGDPYYRFNDIIYQSISLVDFTYARTFELSKDILNRKHVILACDGLDTVASVLINGKLAGTTTNMFVRYTFDIKELLQEGANTVSIQFMSAVNYAKKAAASYPYHHVPPDCPPPEQQGQCHVNFIRKEQCSFSWDWGPSFPTQGIWQNISIQTYDYAALSDVTMNVLQQDSGDWTVRVTAFFDTPNPGSHDVLLEVYMPTIELANKSFTTTDNSSVELWLYVPAKSVQLWWPNGYGSQQLYPVQVRLTVNSADVSERSLRLGFRTIELVQEPIEGSPGLSFYFKVNGEPIFMKGSNWIPADAFQERVNASLLRSLLTSAAVTHQNMIRVWGGGVYEQDALYDIADELGILIWQDFMFSCALYPINKEFLADVNLEVVQQIRRLQHHACIAVWAGNNENEAALRDDWYDAWNTSQALFEQYRQDYVTLYIDTIMAAVQREDPSSIFVSSSPSNGKESESEGWIATNPYDSHYGDVHLYNYDAGSWSSARFYRGRFMSEYGYQSWPSFSSISRISTPEDWGPSTNFSQTRNHHPGGQSQLWSEVTFYFNPPVSSDNATYFANYIYLTQINQAMSIKVESEFYRRSQSSLFENANGHTMGAMYWQLNDIWQAPTWASLEYTGKWKMLHYYAEQFFAPTALSMDVEADVLVVYLMQDRLGSSCATKLSLFAFSWSSNTVPLGVMNVTIPKITLPSQMLYGEPLNMTLEKLGCPSASGCFLVARTDDSQVRETFYLPSAPKNAVGLQQADVKVDSITVQGPRIFQLKITSTSPALFVWLETTVSGHFSKNGFLFYSSTDEVTFAAWEDTTLADFQAGLTVTHLLDIY